MGAASASTWWTPIARKPGQRTQLRVGRLTKAHGLKGGLKIELYTDDPARRFVPGAVFSLQVPAGSKWHGKTIEMREFRIFNSNPVGFFRGVDDRTEAETLVKAILWVDQDAQELPEESDAWYVHQLSGLNVIRDGEQIGIVARVDAFPAQDLLAIDVQGTEYMLPFVKAFVPEIDLHRGTVTITPPKGLFEELPEDAEPADG
ncbi:MAG TPA: ribosome maturation factor RimM [Candidatus Agrococcus pullicola]|uniref:Ribosome maturation factor RimM n=1 Tax=Candidatus Agrococcus pullicola TaxID=2838429 RepID=A0A9D1YTM7_9MICO|nr:ribosome maturation factor RimM [Candidatus Agrococcus pullicola]